MAFRLTADKFDEEKERLVGGTVTNLIMSIRPAWDRLSVANTVFLGFALGLVLGVGPQVMFGWPVMVPGFFIYFPFMFGSAMWRSVCCFPAVGELMSWGKAILHSEHSLDTC